MSTNFLRGAAKVLSLNITQVWILSASSLTFTNVYKVAKLDNQVKSFLNKGNFHCIEKGNMWFFAISFI